MQTLTEQLTTLTDFFTTFSLGNLIAKDALGNVDLTRDSLGNPVLLGGKLKAKILETGGLVIEVVDVEAPTIGRGKLPSGENKVVIKTTNVKTKSHIIVTPRTLSAEPLSVTDVTDGKDFTVEVPSAALQDISFDWWVVEEK